MELKLDDYNESTVMYHIKCCKGDIGKYVLLPGDPFRTDLIASFLEKARLLSHNREHKIWNGYLDGELVSVCSTGMGCPSTAIAVEELIKCGAETLIRIGTAGRVCDASMDEKLDGAICTAAVRDEGTTIQYIPVEYPAVADRFVVNALSKAALVNNYNAIEGIVHSKDAFYGETNPDSCPNADWLKYRWNAWKSGNVVCSEMESSAIFVISSIRGCRSGSIMSLNPHDELCMKKTIEVACEAVRILIADDRNRGVGSNG